MNDEIELESSVALSSTSPNPIVGKRTPVSVPDMRRLALQIGIEVMDHIIMR
jgi:hypothetical protein